MRPTSTYIALESRLGQPLDEAISRWRAAGATWRVIAADLRERTGVDVSHETLRGWFREAAA